jgi:hypothetical protein
MISKTRQKIVATLFAILLLITCRIRNSRLTLKTRDDSANLSGCFDPRRHAWKSWPELTLAVPPLTTHC